MEATANWKRTRTGREFPLCPPLGAKPRWTPTRSVVSPHPARYQPIRLRLAAGSATGKFYFDITGPTPIASPTPVTTTTLARHGYSLSPPRGAGAPAPRGTSSDGLTPHPARRRDP